MTFVNRKHFQKLYIIIFLVLLNNCQLKEPNKPHGINFLENREKTLVVGKTNQNDVIRLIGNPHSTSIKDKDTWIYFERTITRGKMIKLGQNVLKENNLLELKFNKYGILMSKNFFTKEDMNKIAYIDKKTENNISQPSFVGKFLSSMRQKMYGKRKF
ncbi:outer membrane protein assembly factor BamE [Pelagibacteraceae bacterium]|nr:outer membrane protein assembly factor BamE [Pelagibacteraceae bacterium]|tara:strand:- start:785 stop:1258 length:474 start_codon:yes stop_codon:yes gene_type:complete